MGAENEPFRHDLRPIQAGTEPPFKLQAKRTVNTPGAPDEQEADRVSDQVIRPSEPRLQRACLCGGECPTCQEEQPGQGHEALRAKVPARATWQTAVPAIVRDVLCESHRVNRSTRRRRHLHGAVGHDFRRVQVHTDARASESARAVDASAYTVGRDVVFGAGRYWPGTNEGRRLIAHELTHVIQQGEGASPSASASLAIDTFGEAAAEQASDQVMSGHSASHVDAGHGTSIHAN